MANTLRLTNFDTNNILGQTKLTADIARGVNSLPVQDGAAFVTGGYIIVGNLGGAQSEMITANAISIATTIPLASATGLAHNFNDAITLLFGNQLNVYRANDVYANGVQPPDANFSLLPSGTVNILPNDALTAFTDSTGVSGQWYKFTHFNSTTSAETLLSDSRAVQAGIIHIVSLDQVRRAASLPRDTRVGLDLIAEYRDAAEKEVYGALQSVYALPLPQPFNPIVVQIVKNIAAGELMQEVYSATSPQMAALGETKAAHGRSGDGDAVTGLAQLVSREIILQDANYMELVEDEVHAFGGYPDNTTATLPRDQGGDHGFHFKIDKIY